MALPDVELSSALIVQSWRGGRILLMFILKRASRYLAVWWDYVTSTTTPRLHMAGVARTSYLDCELSLLPRTAVEDMN